MSSSQLTYIYHITHIDNLPMILDAGGLFSDTRKATLPALPTSIAYEDIKEKRARKMVTCGPAGCVADYVPFYFAPKSPMLYTISRGNIQGRKESDIVYLVSTVEHVCGRGLGYIFTDGHPIMAFTSFYDSLNNLDQVDWQLMESNYWNDIATDMDRKRRRQAEFLVRDFFPLDLVGLVATSNEHVRKSVASLLECLPGTPAVAVKREWYYG